MRNFVVTSRKTNTQVILKYNASGYLYGWEILGEFNNEQWRWAASVGLTGTVDLLMEHKKKGLQVSDMVEDLSFETFWSKYGNKVKRIRAEKIWLKMNDADKLRALLGIWRYDKYLMRTGQAKAHPSTYLQDKRWEDEY